MDKYDIDEFLEKWYTTKQQIADLEKKLEKYKTMAETFMDHKNTDVLSTPKYKLQKRDINKTTLSKNDLPSEIWNKYAKEHFYSAYYISKISEKKRSVRRSKKI